MTMRITLTTDFGERDPYVGAMKGVIYSISPESAVVDLTHEIAPHDIMEGALFLEGALPHWPAGSIHVAVVDPGVGTDRRAVAISAGGRVLLCPDNGLATFYLRDADRHEARVIQNTRFMRANISATFHGRDVFAPAAAHLAAGVRFDDLGPPATDLAVLPIPEVESTGSRILGQIVHVDRFGNLITNIHQRVLPGRIRGIEAGGERVAGPCRTYADAPLGTPAALIGSSGHLEIAVNGASAQDALQLSRGDSVIILVE